MSTDKMYTLGIDVGYGDVKVVVGTEHEIVQIYKFPSVVSPVAVSDHFKDTRAIVVDNNSYYVGADALAMEVEHQYSVDEYKHLELFTPVFLMSVFKKLDKDVNINRIVLGLSIAQIQFSQNYHLKVRGFLDSLGMTNVDIMIIPQGTGVKLAYDTHADKFPALSDSVNNSNYLICDIGFNTIDILYVIEGKVTPNRISGLERMGLTLLAKMLDDEIKKKYPNISLSVKDLKVILERGFLKLRGVQIDVRDVIDDLKISYLKIIENMLESNYGKVLDRVDFLLLAGGGAMYFDSIKNEFYRTTGKSSEYYNAIGYYLRGKNK